MHTYSLFLLAIQGTIIAAAVIIVWRYGHRLATKSSPAPASRATNAESARRLRALLDESTRVLGDHAQHLRKFEGVLASDASQDAEGIDNSTGDDCVANIRRANARVESTFDQLSACFAEIGQELPEVAAPDVATYQTKTAALDLALEGDDAEVIFARLASRLLDMVQELRKENVELRDEVNRAKDQVIEHMARAHTAEQVARIDVLTQLPNRRAFEEALAQCQAALERRGQPFTLLLLDLDHFKRLNDQHGHAAGDAMLATIGRLLAETCRTTDQACRLGGEEFALLLPKCDGESARTVAERYRQKIEAATLHFQGKKLSITVSGGLAEAVSGESLSRLLERADQALYAAKSQGRNCICSQDALAPEPVS